jgi:hypothetical protein
MKHILMLAGLTSYQAGCVSPFLWFLLFAGIASTLIPVLLDGEEARR